MAGLGLVGLDGAHVEAVETAAYPAGTTPSGACHGGHHDCATFDVGIAGDEVLAEIKKTNTLKYLFLKIIELEMVFFFLACNSIHILYDAQLWPYY